jgi:hypothetical protein
MTKNRTDGKALRRKYAPMKHEWDVTQRRKDPAVEKVTREREIPALVCRWKTFIRIETKEINVAYIVHLQPVRSRLSSSEMFIVGHFQN